MRITDGPQGQDETVHGQDVAARVTDCLYQGDRWLLTVTAGETSFATGSVAS